MRIGLRTNLDSSLGREIYRRVAARVRDSGWHLVRRHGMVYPLERADAAEIDVLIAPVRDAATAAALMKSGVAVINYTNVIETDGIFQVVHDQREIGRMAAAYLHARGLERIGLIAYRDSVFSRARAAGFREGLAAQGGNVAVEMEGDLRELAADGLVERLHGKVQELDAVYCVNDYLAAQVIFALERMGLRVPDDLSVLGTDHEDILSCWLGRSLSSVVLDYTGMADAINRTLQRIAETGDRTPMRITVPPLEVFPGETVTRRLPSDEGLRRAMVLLQGPDLRELDTDRLAAQAGMSRRSFQTRFQAETGQSVGAAIIEARIDLARRWLAEKAPTLEAIAERCGYADRHHFSVRFKAETGFTPAAYRKRVRRE